MKRISNVEKEKKRWRIKKKHKIGTLVKHSNIDCCFFFIQDIFQNEEENTKD